jgi:Protein of unknown function (DUF1353)
MFSRFAIVLAIAISVPCPFARGQHHAVEAEAATPLGHFVGVVKTLWSDNGRDMKLLEDFSYVDPDGLLWKAPAGSVTDGASIPRSAWSIIGGPFEGPYRLAAVIHDVACEKKERSWESAHEMFYRAMLTAHVNEVQAKIMYAAVYHFGPRWDLVTVAKGVPNSETSAAVNSIQHSVHSTNSDAQIESRSASPSENNKQDLTIRFIPPPNTFTESDFESLRAMISARETAKPGSVSLEEIRNYHISEVSR